MRHWYNPRTWRHNREGLLPFQEVRFPAATKVAYWDSSSSAPSDAHSYQQHDTEPAYMQQAQQQMRAWHADNAPVAVDPTQPPRRQRLGQYLAERRHRPSTRWKDLYPSPSPSYNNDNYHPAYQHPHHDVYPPPPDPTPRNNRNRRLGRVTPTFFQQYLQYPPRRDSREEVAAADASYFRGRRMAPPLVERPVFIGEVEHTDLVAARAETKRIIGRRPKRADALPDSGGYFGWYNRRWPNRG